MTGIAGRRGGLLVALVLLAGGCGPDMSRDDARELRVAVGSDLRSSEPGVNRDAVSDEILNHVVEGLVAYREDMTVGLALAERVDLSADRRSYSFRLRPDLVFHNGEPVTAREAKWSLERAFHPGSKFSCSYWFDGSQGHRIAGIETPDRLTLRVTLDRPDAMFLTKLANHQCLVGIMHPASVARDGSWAGPVGTGPFRVASHRRGEYVMLERFAAYRPRAEARDGYAGGRRALVDRIRWQVIPDPASARAALVAGEVDIVGNVDVGAVDELKAQRGIHVVSVPGYDWTALLMRSRSGLLADRNLRLAIAHAIDYPGLANAASFGLSKANPSIVPLDSPDWLPGHAAGYAFDPALARRYLARSGYRGEPLVIDTSRAFPMLFDNAVYIQSMLRNVGIDARIEATEWTGMMSRYLAGDFSLMTMQFSGRPDPVLGYRVILGDFDRDAWVQWQSNEAAALLETAAAGQAPDERRPVFVDVHRAMIRDIPILQLYNIPVVNAWRSGLKGVQPWGLNKLRLWGVARQ